MRLIELSANRQSFKTVSFNRSGLTLIVGRHKSAKRPDIKKTYNGVGKSLIVALINYCLGSNKNEHFDNHLPGWAFTLRFEHAGFEHTITRSTGESKLEFDGIDLSLGKFRDRLDELDLFSIPYGGINYLTCKSLLSFFLRPSNDSYTKYDFPQSKWTDYQSVLCQSFLLGLNFDLAVSKHENKKKLDEQLGLAERYKKDKDLREFYLGEKNAEVELLELETQIKKLTADLGAFRVAENYNQRQHRADELHRRLTSVNNELVVHRNLLRDIQLALTIRPDVPPEQVISVFKEASINLPEIVIKRLIDVQEFHHRLQENRKIRLSGELTATEKKIEEMLRATETLRAELDAELQFLNAHRALDEYAENSAHLSELRAREQRIKDYLELLSQYIELAQNIRATMAQETVDTNHYLRTARPHLESLMENFRIFSKELYGPVSAGLTIKNNDGENQCRYDIQAHIENDAADGINQGKIFCYDLLLLSLRQRHRIDFLFHDNRLFADMDKNQRFSLFLLAERICQKLDTQYIATVNEDVIDSVYEIASDHFERLFKKPVVLELTDASGGSGKLLGMQIDMSYDGD